MEEVKLLKVFAGTQNYSFDGELAVECYAKLVEAIRSQRKYITLTNGNLTSLIILSAITSIDKRGF